MKKILLVSHCVLNTAAKLKQFHTGEVGQEDALRHQVVRAALDHDIQLLQLPCPELLQYGARRWGHTCDQFDNVFFRQRCREMLQPIVMQVQEYLANPEEFEVLGILGIDGSPSCGVDFTCSAPWGGEFSGRSNITEVLGQVTCIPEHGVLMDVLCQMMQEEGISLPLVGLDARNPQPLFDLLEADPS